MTFYKINRPPFHLLISVLCIFIIATCIKIERVVKVTTGAVSEITNYSAKAIGNIIDTGDGIIQHGHCWSTSPNADISGSNTSLGQRTNTGSFTSNLQNLRPGTKYYVKAYAQSKNGVVYGNETSFVTTFIVLPSLTTTTVSSVTQSTALSGGNITSDGGDAITARGVCWATTVNPTTAGNKTSDGMWTGSFTSEITGLSPNTTYHVRAYATNSAGTAYGSDVTFTTPSAIVIPTVTTVTPTATSSTTATSGGNITSDGGATVTARGVCWSTSSNPTVALSTKTTNGTGTGSFTSEITGLSPNTTYYVRAYATNSAGTGYGADVTFTTPPAIVSPTVTTGTTTVTSSTTASSGGNVTSDGGASVTARGVCWSTSSNPTVALSTKMTNGTGIGSFTSEITELSPNTTYHVRAYATNSAGTGYGADFTFTTPPAIVSPTVTTGTITATSSTTASSGGNVTSDGGATVTARGVCWSTSVNPTVDLTTKTTDGTGTGTFTSNITGLTENTLYHVRAYAVNDAGVGYGADISFKSNYANCIPSLFSPSSYLVMDNGCSETSDVLSWTFDWSDCDGATSYNIYVGRTTLSDPIIDQITSESNYTYVSTSYIENANRLDYTWKVRAYINGVWGEWSDETAMLIEPLNSDCPVDPPSGVAYMFQQLETVIPSTITYLQHLMANNPELKTQIQAKIDMLQTTNLANDIVEGNRSVTDNVKSIDGGNISLNAVFPLENMRADANQTIASLKLALPILETFVSTPYPSDYIYEWYGFILGNFGGLPTINMEDKESYESRTGPDRLLYEDILFHEFSHSYIKHETLTHFLATYLYNMVNTGTSDIHSWTYFEMPYTEFDANNAGLNAILDIYQLLGHDGMMKAFKILVSLNPPYGSPLSTECKQAFIDQAPENLKTQVRVLAEAIGI